MKEDINDNNSGNSSNKPIKSALQQIYGHEPATMDELGHCLIKLLDHNLASTGGAKCVGLHWELFHSQRVGNSLAAPEGCATNWRGTFELLPQGYPGWIGRVWVRYGPDSQGVGGCGFGSKPFDNTLTHVSRAVGLVHEYNSHPWADIVHTKNITQHGFLDGDDGVISYRYSSVVNCYSWELRIFDADWPVVAMMNVLRSQDGCQSNHSHTFKWDDPEVVLADQRYMASCSTILL